MKTPAADLAERLTLLRLRHDIVFPNRCMEELLSPQVWATETVGGLIEGSERAANAAKAVVDASDLIGEDFWATPLGRLMFAAGCFPRESMTAVGAAKVLSCSRQYVHSMIGRGRIRTLGESQGPPFRRDVLASDVRAVLVAKVDKEVNRM